MKEPQIVQIPGEPSRQLLRFILTLAHIFLIILLLTWMVLARVVGEPYEKTWQIMLLQFFFGRAAAVGTGLNLRFNVWFLFYQAAMVDMILMLYVYPTFVRGYQHLTRVPLIGSYLANLHQVALGHKKRMAPYGVVGLMLFVIFPFWSTGCVVGSIVGYLIGLSTVLTLVSVTVGNVIAIGAWILFYDRLRSWNETYALALLVIIFAFTIGGIFFSRFKKKRKQAEEREILAYLEAVKSILKEEEDAPYPQTQTHVEINLSPVNGETSENGKGS